jgi:hypothetical protein
MAAFPRSAISASETSLVLADSPLVVGDLRAALLRLLLALG